MDARFIALGLAAGLSIGCSQSPSLPTGPSSLLSTGAATAATADSLALAARSDGAGARGAQAVPFKGRLEGVVSIEFLDPPMAFVFIEGSGQATQLGQFTVEVPHLVSFATATGTGTFEFVAANGDRLTAEFHGSAQTDTPVFRIVEHATITSGTGRFTGASGTFTVVRDYDTTTDLTTGSFEGTISLRGQAAP